MSETMVTEEMVEAGARVVHERLDASLEDDWELPRRAWEDLPEDERRELMDETRAALTAALAAGDMVMVPKMREFICKSCYLRAEEGKPEADF